MLRGKRPWTNGLSEGTDWGAVIEFQISEELAVRIMHIRLKKGLGGQHCQRELQSG